MDPKKKNKQNVENIVEVLRMTKNFFNKMITPSMNNDIHNIKDILVVIQVLDSFGSIFVPVNSFRQYLFR